MPDFELNQPDYYTPILVEETDFDPDQYGNTFYSVVFEGDASSHLWKAKNKPEINTKYYGHLEKSRSGKAIIFKRDKEPEGATPSKVKEASKKSDAYLKDASTTPIAIYNGSLNYAKESGLNLITDKDDRRIYLEYVKAITDEMLDWIELIREGKKPDPVIDPDKLTEEDLET